MKPTTWEDGTPRSTGNGFDLQARMARGPIIFCNLTTKQAAAGSQGGVLSASTVATVKGLSKRAQKQLSATGQAITIGRPGDAEKRRKNRKANI